MKFFRRQHVSVEFGLSGGPAKRAQRNSVRFHFFGETFGEKQIKRFCGRIRRNVGNGLEGKTVDARSARRRGGARPFPVNTAGSGGTTAWQSLAHVEQALLFNGMKFAVLPKPALLISRSISMPFSFGKGKIFSGAFGSAKSAGKTSR